MVKKVYLLLVLLLTLGVVAGYGIAGAQETTSAHESAAKKPTAKKAPVVVALNQQKKECTDCHKGKIKLYNGKVKDITLAGVTNRIPKHPKVKPGATVKTCMVCHKKPPVQWIP